MSNSQTPLVNHSGLSFTRLLPVNNSHLPYHNHWRIPLLLSFIKRLLPSKSISLTLLGNPSPFDFDQPHCNELLSDFMPVTPAEISKLYSSQYLTNRRSLTTSQPHYWSHVQTFSPSSFHILQTYLSPKPHFYRNNSNLHSSRIFWKSLAYQSLCSRFSGLFQI